MFENMNPLDKSTATLEILIILLVSFIIGFIIGWLLRRGKSSTTETTVDLSGYESEINDLKSKNTSLSADLKACQESKIKAPEVSVEKKAPVVAAASGGSFSVTDEDRKNAEKLGFSVAKGDQKDDLKLIKGVGPFIEKKMNALGIYTFEQVSEFSKETIDKVTEAIEFFPGRIERDNWVGQSKELMKK